MKKITLVRHAKSSWDDFNMTDHDRPLNARGFRDAPLMAQRMASLGWRPDILISSTANRAKTTAGFFAQALGLHASDVLLRENIYHAPPGFILTTIAQLDEAWEHVALFGHNPTMTMVANLFYGDDFLDNLPTCGIVEIVAPTATTWDAFTPDTARVKDIHYPKEFSND